MTNKGKGWRLATMAAALMMAGSAWATEYSASFKNADIEEFINTVGKNLNKTIIIEPSVRGKINVRSYDLLNEDQYYQFFLSVLDVYGFAVVPMNNGVLKVVRSKDAKTSAIPVVDDTNPGVGDEMVTRVVPVRNVSVRELAPCCVSSTTTLAAATWSTMSPPTCCSSPAAPQWSTAWWRWFAGWTRRGIRTWTSSSSSSPPPARWCGW